MNRMEIFSCFYKLLNDFVIYYELLFRKNEVSMHKKLVNIHKKLINENEGQPDERFLNAIEIERSNLLSDYLEVTEKYFVNGIKTFKSIRGSDKRVGELYNEITMIITDANTTDGTIDIHEIIKRVDEIERRVQPFVANLK